MQVEPGYAKLSLADLLDDADTALQALAQVPWRALQVTCRTIRKAKSGRCCSRYRPYGGFPP